MRAHPEEAISHGASFIDVSRRGSTSEVQAAHTRCLKEWTPGPEPWANGLEQSITSFVLLRWTTFVKGSGVQVAGKDEHRIGAQLSTMPGLFMNRCAMPLNLVQSRLCCADRVRPNNLALCPSALDQMQDPSELTPFFAPCNGVIPATMSSSQ